MLPLLIAPHRRASNEYPKHTFSWRNNKYHYFDKSTSNKFKDDFNEILQCIFTWINKQNKCIFQSLKVAYKYQNPFIRSIISLMCSLMTNTLTVVAKAFSNTK